MTHERPREKVVAAHRVAEAVEIHASLGVAGKGISPAGTEKVGEAKFELRVVAALTGSCVHGTSWQCSTDASTFVQSRVVAIGLKWRLVAARCREARIVPKS
jgi:hypothetical protein